MKVTELNIENEAIGLKGSIVEVFEEALKKATEWSYRCDNGWIVIYGGFTDNKLDEKYVEVEYVADKHDIEEDGHVKVPLYVTDCRLRELVGMDWGDVEEKLESEYESACDVFGAMYQRGVTVSQILRREPLGM